MNEILKSLQLVNEELGHIKKNQKGHNYQFRGIDQVLNSLSPLFKKHKILVSRRNLETERTTREVEAKYGTKQYVETFIRKCDYVFTSTVDGSEFISQGFGEGQDSSGGDKSSSMATSNSFKYVVFEMFTVATEEQKDSDQVTAEVAAREKKEEEILLREEGLRKNLPPKPKPMVDVIANEIARLTSNFKNKDRLLELCANLGVENPGKIKLEKNEIKLSEWYEYLKGLK